MTAFCERPAHEQRAALRDGRIGARALLEAHLERHAALHPVLNAVVVTDLVRARAEADRIDRGDGPTGPLAGLPMTVKDCFDLTGTTTACGSPVLAQRGPAGVDADVVAAVRAAGAVVWGKTNVPLMLADLQTHNAVYGETTHPLDPARTPGGSSGGAAAALAAGVTPLEIGSDLGGSLRTPASFCGVVALKPGPGRLSTRGQTPPDPEPALAAGLPVVGPMARTAADAALLWRVLRGATDPTPDPDPPTRLAVWVEDPHLLCGRGVRDVVLETADRLAGARTGISVVRPPVPSDVLLDAYLTLLFGILTVGAPTRLRERMHAARPAALAALADGASRYGADAATVYSTADPAERAGARRALDRLRHGVTALFATHDAVLAPATAVPAFPRNTAGPVADRILHCDGRSEPYRRLLDWAAPATALGLPAVVVPAGTVDGLPVGVQLIGPPGSEDRLLVVAGHVERVLDGDPAAAPAR